MSLHVVPPVCAEAFNPDDEDEDTEPRVVHPKTDEQRCRLQEACRDILLFKTLDQVNKTYSTQEETCAHTLTYQCTKPFTYRWVKVKPYIKYLKQARF